VRVVGGRVGPGGSVSSVVSSAMAASKPTSAASVRMSVRRWLGLRAASISDPRPESSAGRPGVVGRRMIEARIIIGFKQPL
jgi:hypothetical protein